MVSIAGMISRLEGSLGTNDLSDWEDSFIQDVVEKVGREYDTSKLTDKQVTKVEEIFKRHHA